jgi:hypothetical protein
MLFLSFMTTNVILISSDEDDPNPAPIQKSKKPDITLPDFLKEFIEPSDSESQGESPKPSRKRLKTISSSEEEVAASPPHKPLRGSRYSGKSHQHLEKRKEIAAPTSSDNESDIRPKTLQSKSNIVIDSDTSEDLATPFKKRHTTQSNSSDSDIVTPHSRSKSQLSKKSAKRVTRSMGTSPEIYSLPSSEEEIIQRPKKRKKKKEIVEEEEEDLFEDIVSDSSDQSVYNYGAKTLYCHQCGSDQPYDNFSGKQQQNAIDRYCLKHSWARGQTNYMENLQARVRHDQEFLRRIDERYGEVGFHDSEYESDEFITNQNDVPSDHSQL